MRILSMTATFGKLEHATLTLEPGLNIIQAPNEWGKSTWCAFLVNMLYGIDTRSRSTGSVLADKERYAPWSGAAMSGRIELEWNGRHITIERRTKGRVPFGDFNAYETETGIEVTELNATNCGQMLLGVERSVFVRSGFLKLADLPVSQDEALRRRLNNLVTTGDESGAGDKLGQTIKDLKNKCRFNQSGLLPQAETEREQLRYQLQQLQQLRSDAESIRQQQTQLEQQILQLNNHRDALLYQASLEDARQVEAADNLLEQLTAQVQQLTEQCAQLPEQQLAQAQLDKLLGLLEQEKQLQLQTQMLPSPPEKPPVFSAYADPVQAVETAKADHTLQTQLAQARTRQSKTTPLLALGIGAIVLVAALLGAILLQQPWLYSAGGAALMLSVALIFGIGGAKTKQLRQQLDAIYDRHPGLSPDQWISHAEEYLRQQEGFAARDAEYNRQLQQLNEEKNTLQEQLHQLTADTPPAQYRQTLEQALASHKRLLELQQELSNAQRHAAALRSVAKTVDAPKAPDELTLDQEQTHQALAQAQYQQHQLQLQLGQCLGQAEALGQESLLRARLDTLNRRIARLEDTYHALELAQDALYQASTALQRRFAPRISKRAQELFSRLTDGRYQRITMAEDLTLSTGAEDEDTVHTAQWRSDGTADQLYLALRLAVAAELTPDAPLVLDDALVRFDDSRLKTAMAILREEAQQKQVILFTCQSRESEN